MSNMSYCRWENTSKDMIDCLEAMREFDSTSEDYFGEEGEEAKTNFECLSSSEKSGFYTVLSIAQQLIDLATDEQLNMAGIDR